MASLATPLVMTNPSSSAAGLLSYLEEDDVNLKVNAINRLHRVLDLHWTEVCDALPTIEALSEDAAFPGAHLAAAIASKCFYHLQEYNDALRLALCAGKYFDVSERSEYVETILSKCIDEYIALRRKQHDAKPEDEVVVIDPKMEAVIEQMFQRCYRDRSFKQALGVALDARRIDKVSEVCDTAIRAGQPEILDHTFNLFQASRSIASREFRLGVIAVLVDHYSTLAHPDVANVCLCLQHLNRPADVAQAIHKLCVGTEEESLLAYQICFDLQETENQGFVLRVVSSFPVPLKDIGASAEAEAALNIEPAILARLKNVKRILMEGFDIDLHLNFLFFQSRTHYKALNEVKAATEGRTIVLHNAAVVAHGYLNCGTTTDTFLRQNLDWLGRASCWSKFTAVASIGVVNKGHVHESMNLLQPYLPQGGMSSSPYSESGALYALGLIHANKGGSGDSTTISYLTAALRNAGTNETVQHGACLGLGLAAMATADEALFEELKGILYTDNAIAAEGAAFAMGLIMLGQSDTPLAQNEVPELLRYMHDTAHEKIIRALSLAIAMMTYGKEESADVLIEQLVRDRDPIVRYGGMFAIGMAYCGTGDNGAVRKLLHVAVSDVNDDVRRSAVMALGFVLFRSPEVVPKLVSLLAESFNAHLRYGACMAIGIACAGTGSQEALDLLLPLMKDSTDFVRQAAFMSAALVLMQVSEVQNPEAKKLRETLMEVVKSKAQSALSKSGAILAIGILDAGGKNVSISMESRTGFTKMGSVVGLMMWLQYWYWYPLMHFLSLSMTPTAMIGLNKDFDMPKDFSAICNSKPSVFAYPVIEEKKDDVKEKVVTAVLSTTAKSKAREARKEARKLVRHPSADGSIPLERVNSSGIQLDRVNSSGAPLERNASLMSTVSHLSVEEEPPKPVEPEVVAEPTQFVLSNPSRLIHSQVPLVSLDAAQRYTPVLRRFGKAVPPVGIVVLSDKTPDAPADVAKVARIALGQEDEAEPPQPFVWTP